MHNMILYNSDYFFYYIFRFLSNKTFRSLDTAYFKLTGNMCSFFFRAYLYHFAMQNKVQLDKEIIIQAEEKDFQVCSAINNEWNAEVAKQREVRLANMREKRRENFLQKLLNKEQHEIIQKNNIDKKIRKAKEEASTFITAKNVDAAIEECLTNIVDHNRALDLEGNWHNGNYPPVPPLEERQKPAVVEN